MVQASTFMIAMARAALDSLGRHLRAHGDLGSKSTKEGAQRKSGSKAMRYGEVAALFLHSMHAAHSAGPHAGTKNIQAH
eukprot:292480-Pelagomonas_calceolata.AAC.11